MRWTLGRLADDAGALPSLWSRPLRAPEMACLRPCTQDSTCARRRLIDAAIAASKSTPEGQGQGHSPAATSNACWPRGVRFLACWLLSAAHRAGGVEAAVPAIIHRQVPGRLRALCRHAGVPLASMWAMLGAADALSQAAVVGDLSEEQAWQELMQTILAMVRRSSLSHASLFFGITVTRSSWKMGARFSHMHAHASKPKGATVSCIAALERNARNGCMPPGTGSLYTVWGHASAWGRWQQRVAAAIVKAMLPLPRFDLRQTTPARHPRTARLRNTWAHWLSDAQQRRPMQMRPASGTARIPNGLDFGVRSRIMVASRTRLTPRPRTFALCIDHKAVKGIPPPWTCADDQATASFMRCRWSSHNAAESCCTDRTDARPYGVANPHVDGFQGHAECIQRQQKEHCGGNRPAKHRECLAASYAEGIANLEGAGKQEHDPCTSVALAHDAADDERNPEELAQVQPLSEEQGTQDDDSDARYGGPDGVANADIKGQQGKAEEVGGDGSADQCGGCPVKPGAGGPWVESAAAPIARGLCAASFPLKAFPNVRVRVSSAQRHVKPANPRVRNLRLAWAPMAQGKDHADQHHLRIRQSHTRAGVLADRHDIVASTRRARKDRVGAAGDRHRRFRERCGTRFVQPWPVRQAGPSGLYRENPARAVVVGQEGQPHHGAVRGMKRRVMIAKALSHEPQILFLDEPTAGVDVELRRSMWDMVRRLRGSGVTIMLDHALHSRKPGNG
ncbi:hypothetical protein FQR65_LT18922 [Abscondita terminalis]|nr:hypothetical protein FQR65_LT18922 [Abscondita terminalis]